MFYRIIILTLLILSVACSGPSVNQSSVERQEFQLRYNMTYKRLTSDIFKPEFTESFILADVQNSPENVRRFNEYSGDLSGRFIEALSLTAVEKDIEFLHKIVREALLFQRTDGRFGNTELNFQQSDITGEHMALLWGNGRMLVGLLAYYDRFKDENVLNAAIKVGDFYLTVF